MINISHTYICHYKKLFNRKKFIIEQLYKNNITDFSFVENYDVDEWDLEKIGKEYKNIFNKTERQNRYLKYSEISLLLKHCFIIQDAHRKKYESVLVLEDDALLVENFTDKFNSYKNQLPLGWDILWIGTCCNLHANFNNRTNIYRMNGSRCTHAFILSSSCIEKLVVETFNADREADWYYNFLIEKFNLNNYWAEPPLAIQNSEFISTIQD